MFSLVNLGDLAAVIDSSKAQAWYGLGLEIARRLAVLEPRNARCQSDLCTLYRKMGDTARAQAPLEALDWYRQAVEQGELLVALWPADRNHIVDLQNCCNEAARLTEGADPGSARSWLERGVELTRLLIKLDPAAENWRYRLSTWLSRLGYAEQRLGIEQAEVGYREALEIQEGVVAARAYDPGTLLVLATTLKLFAAWQRSAGRVAEERRLTERRLSIFHLLSQRDPRNATYMRELAMSYNKLGDLDRRVDLAKARTWYEQGLEIRRRLAALEPENTGYLRDLSVSYERLGDLDGRVDPAKARAWYEQGLEIRRRLAALEPENSGYLRDLGISFWKIGDTERSNAPAEALLWYRQAAECGERLVALMPRDRQFLSDLVYYCDRAARLYETVQRETARPWLERGVELGRGLLALAPATGQRLGLSRWLVRLGHVEKGLGIPGAEGRYRDALELRQAVVDAEPENVEAWGLIASALGSLAEWHLLHDQPDQERECSEQANVAMERAAALKPDDADVQYGLACTRALLGLTDDALTALARSAELGNTDADRAAQDPDLRSLRGLPEFEAILARMRRPA